MRAMSDSTMPPSHVAGPILTYYRNQRPHTLHVGIPVWYRWLQTATLFTYSGDARGAARTVADRRNGSAYAGDLPAAGRPASGN